MSIIQLHRLMFLQQGAPSDSPHQTAVSALYRKGHADPRNESCVLVGHRNASTLTRYEAMPLR